jgi:hypothetical protein
MSATNGEEPAVTNVAAIVRGKGSLESKPQNATTTGPARITAITTGVPGSDGPPLAQSYADVCAPIHHQVSKATRTRPSKAANHTGQEAGLTPGRNVGLPDPMIGAGYEQRRELSRRFAPFPVELDNQPGLRLSPQLGENGRRI